MIFRRTILAALLVGFVAGLALSIVQVLSVNPIIFAAESFEVEQPHDHATHDHSEQAWSPEEGAQRTGYTVLANICAGIGFSAMVLALMSQLQLQGLTRINVCKGLLWGTAGFVVFFVAPGIGLPPEIPGIEAAAVEHRQAWWLLAVLSVAGGLMLVSFASVKFKIAGLFLVLLPYVVNIPHHQGPAFSHPDAETVATLTQLHQQFIVVSGLSNFVFWLVIGVLAAWVLNAWVLKDMTTNTSDRELASA